MKSPRAEQLDLIRDLVVLSKNEKITSLKELKKRAYEEKIFAKKTGKKWKYSRIFQYTEGLRWFGLNHGKQGSGKIILSKTAEELAKYGKKNYRTGKLSKQEIITFRNIIFDIDHVQDNFIKYFSPKQEPIRTYQEFTRVALPIYIIRTYRKEMREDNFGKVRFRRLCDIETEVGNRYEEIESTEFLHTITCWMLDLNVINKFLVPPHYKVERNYTLFPIKTQFDNYSKISKLEEIIKKICPSKQMVIPIPILIYTMCKEFCISVQNAKNIIRVLYRKKPQVYYLNRAPETLLDMKYADSYITVDGFWRGELSIRRL